MNFPVRSTLAGLLNHALNRVLNHLLRQVLEWLQEENLRSFAPLFVHHCLDSLEHVRPPYTLHPAPCTLRLYAPLFVHHCLDSLEHVRNPKPESRDPKPETLSPRSS